MYIPQALSETKQPVLLSLVAEPLPRGIQAIVWSLVAVDHHLAATAAFAAAALLGAHCAEPTTNSFWFLALVSQVSLLCCPTTKQHQKPGTSFLSTTGCPWAIQVIARSPSFQVDQSWFGSTDVEHFAKSPFSILLDTNDCNCSSTFSYETESIQAAITKSNLVNFSEIEYRACTLEETFSTNYSLAVENGNCLSISPNYPLVTENGNCFGTIEETFGYFFEIEKDHCFRFLFPVYSFGLRLFEVADSVLTYCELQLKLSLALSVCEMSTPGQVGSIPLTEYRRDVPPGWGPGLADYPLRSYFEKLRLWYRVFDGADEVVGPLVAGRLVGRAQKLAVNLRLPRPHGGVDVGDQALVRLSVDEVRDPNDPTVIIQHHIPSGVQALCNALRDAFGQSDQDMVSRSLESFFEFKRGKLSLQEYAVEWDLRYDEAETRSNLHLNDVAKFYLWFKQSGLPTKFVEDIKLQLHGDLARFGEARALALRLSQRGQEEPGQVFYEEQPEAEETYWADEWPETEPWTPQDEWSYYGEEAAWHDAPEDELWYADEDVPWENDAYEDWWADEPAHQEEPQDAVAADVSEDYYKGGSKGRNAMGLGCAICGSKWHSSSACPVNSPGKGKGYSSKGYSSKGYGRHKGYGKGKGKKGFRQPWRPQWQSSGKGYGKNHGRWGKGKYYAESDQRVYHSRPPLDANYVKQDVTSNSASSNSPGLTKTPYYRMDAQDEEDLMHLQKPSKTTAASRDPSDQEAAPPKDKVLSFAVFLNGSQENAMYHTIQGKKRRGLLIDPGAASGLIGSETLRDLVEHCIPQTDRSQNVTWSSKTTSVAGISGESDKTLGEVCLRLNASNRNIAYKGDVLGGEGSLCPALVGNPTLRQQQAAMYADWFPNGDGLLAIHREELLGDDKKPILLRLLLTDSGHYLLPVDGNEADTVPADTMKKVSFLTREVLLLSQTMWPSERPQIKHCFYSASDPAETDRSELHGEGQDDLNVTMKTNIKTCLKSSVTSVSDMSKCEDGGGTRQFDLCYPKSSEHEQTQQEDLADEHEEVQQPSRLEIIKGQMAFGHVQQVRLALDNLCTRHQGSDDETDEHKLTQGIPRRQDGWSIVGQWLVREHHVPRRTLFTPNCVKSCPVPMEKILSTRRTEIHYSKHLEDTIEDSWTNPMKAHRDLGQSWTGQTCFLLHDDMEEYWSQKKKLDAWMPHYTGDTFPTDDDHKLKSLRHEYRAMPEEFYTKTGRRVVTPDNVEHWLSEISSQGQPTCHFMELYSGSGRLSLAVATTGLSVSFPIDLRYGWDINDHKHQKLLWKVIEVLKPKLIFAAPRCKFHSTAANTMSPEKKLAGRAEDEPGLKFVKEVFKHQAYSGLGYAAEQPWGSTLFKESALKAEELPGCRMKQRCDQCMLGAVDDMQQPIQKATGIMSNIKWRKTSKRCSGHKGRQHGQLQGKIAGINRTAMAAVYPRTMTQEMCKDIINYLNETHQLRLQAWPRSLQHIWHSHLYDCEKCKLGRSAPSGVEHSLIPGKCRHGKWPTESGKRPRKLAPANPTTDWKKEARKTPMEHVILSFPQIIPLTAQTRVYWKVALMQVIQDALAIFSEATDMGKDYEHWITDQTLMLVLRELLEPVMYLKGVKVCLRPMTKAVPDPQLSIHTAPLRLQVQGTIKRWVMDDLQDMTMCSHRQIREAVEPGAWQITFFGKLLGEGGKRDDSVAKAAPRSVPRTPATGTPAPATPMASIPEHIRPASSSAVLDDNAGDGREDVIEVTDASGSGQQPEQLVPAHDSEPPYEEEEFRARRIVSTKPIYDFKKVFQRLPQLAKEKPDTASRLLLGLHEKYWHAPPKNLLARVGMPVEVLNLVSDAVMKCQICRRYVRLPNRPQMKLNNAGTFNQCVQADLFKLWGTWVFLLVDEATRYKVAVTTESREAHELQQKLLDSWMRYFGPPGALVMDQEASLMSHEIAAEFERLSIERKPKGTTAGAAAAQHTGTGLVERHVGLMKLTMLKLKAELDRQGIITETSEIAMEAAMAHNSTLNYGGVTPAMAVFGILPRGFYNEESPGLMASAGALQTDLTTFEKAVRVRQLSLAAVQQAIVEDRTARANRTRSHRLNTAELVPGTSEVEFYREVQGDVGWRGPALLLRLDPDEGVAVIQYQGRPYLVSIRHIRPHVQTFLATNDTLCLTDQAEDEMLDIMKSVEMVPLHNKRFLGHLLEQKATGPTWRMVPSEDNFNHKLYEKMKTVSASLTSRAVSGMIYGRALKFVKPPKDTIGYLVTWRVGSVKYHIQEHWTADPIKLKKVVSDASDDICLVYMFYHIANQEESVQNDFKRIKDDQNGQLHPLSQSQEGEDMSVDDAVMDDHGQSQSMKRRDGPDSRTVVLAPETKKMRLDYWSSHSVYYNASSVHYLVDRRRKIKTDPPTCWTGTQMWADNVTAEKLFNYDRKNHTYLFHIGASQDSILHVDLRTSEVWKVDTEHSDITEDDVYDIWPEVDAADKAEVEQFVHENAFKKIHRDGFTDDMVIIDARWVRKWKKLSDGKKKVKSRLCARGCLDRQKDLLTTRSTTATRLSQRMLLSTAAVFDLEVESWDIAGAFLKGLDFNQIRRMLRDRGINSPVRTVVIIPPPNVWRHLAAASSDFSVNDPSQWGLMCLKPVYGLNDAPLAWQLCLQEYLKEIHGIPSVMDENSWRWKKPDGSILAICTCHVDDMAIAAPQNWLDKHYKAFVEKFKKVSRQQIPFEHCGARYEKLPDGFRMVQSDFCSKMTSAPVPQNKKDNDKLTKEETTSYRSILGALLWLTATRLDLIADVSHLATHVTSAEIRHLRQANQVLQRAQNKDYQDVGLYFRKLRPERGLRLACFHDSSSHTKEKAYAHEGVLVLLMEDHVVPQDGEFEKVCNDFEAKTHGGHAHVLWSHGSKAKRISYSTSHAETLASISGHEAAMLVSIRLSEVLHRDASPSLQQLAALQEAGNAQLPIDDYGDCNDVFQLVTGCKTLPQDKGQRIYVLSLRESRLAGRIRWMCLVPTRVMVADALTKPMISPQMMQLLTTGTVYIENEETHHVQMKRLPTKYEIEECDLEKTDHELIDQHDQEVLTPQNLWWTPMMAAVHRGVLPIMALMVLSSLPVAKASETENIGHEQSDSLMFAWMVGVTLLVLIVERLMVCCRDKMLSKNREPPNSEHPTTSSSTATTGAKQFEQMLAMETIQAESDANAAKAAEMEENCVRLQFEAGEMEENCAKLQREVEGLKRQLRQQREEEHRNWVRYDRRIQEQNKEIEVLKEKAEPAVTAASSSSRSSTERIPESLYMMPTGECFHKATCSTVRNPVTHPRKLTRCKLCF